MIGPNHGNGHMTWDNAACKCANGLAPAPLADRFLLNKRQSNLTRQNTFCTFKPPQVSSQIGLNSLSFLAADRFNGLPADLRSAPNLLHFTSQLKVFIGYPRREVVVVVVILILLGEIPTGSAFLRGTLGVSL